MRSLSNPCLYITLNHPSIPTPLCYAFIYTYPEFDGLRLLHDMNLYGVRADKTRMKEGTRVPGKIPTLHVPDKREVETLDV